MEIRKKDGGEPAKMVACKPMAKHNNVDSTEQSAIGKEEKKAQLSQSETILQTLIFR